MPFRFVIEHMEDDDEDSKAIPTWVELEYTHMRELAGPESSVHFTNLSRSSVAFLQSHFDAQSSSTLAPGVCHTEGLMDLIKKDLGKDGLAKVCLLDPKAEQELAPEDGNGQFEWFLFGGILGDDPPRDRTGELRVLGFPTRHLGSIQMTTDTALGVTKLVVCDKIRLNDIPFVDHPTITFNPKESVEMPFRYIIENGEPKLPKGMREHLHADLNQSFDF